mmetsp:Transcript_46383/g.68484  ORF Transcript_46383/g.68484 Transcript_46383/m.68484 type:complete len:244 (-) Transcript_46383:139-870(-)
MMKISILLVVTAATRLSAFTPSSSTFGVRNTVTQLFEHTLEGRTIDNAIRPLNNFVLVQVAKADTETSGGIILTNKAQQKKTEGKVVSVGPGKTHQESGIVFEMPVTEGDSVVYGQYDGTEVDYDGEKHTLIRDDDILVKYSGDSLTIDTVEVTNDNVLVYVETKEEETSGGLLIAASSSKKRPSTGEVVKIGPGRMASNGERMAMEVVIGDMIKFRDFAGNEVSIGDQDYSVVRMSDILAKF